MVLWLGEGENKVAALKRFSVRPASSWADQRKKVRELCIAHLQKLEQDRQRVVAIKSSKKKKADKGAVVAEAVAGDGVEDPKISVLARILDEFVWSKVTNSVPESIVVADQEENGKTVARDKLEAYRLRRISVEKLKEEVQDLYDTICSISFEKLKTVYEEQLLRLDEVDKDPVQRYIERVKQGARLLLEVDDKDADQAIVAHEFQKISSVMFRFIEDVPPVTEHQEERREERKRQRNAAQSAKSSVSELE